MVRTADKVHGHGHLLLIEYTDTMVRTVIEYTDLWYEQIREYTDTMVRAADVVRRNHSTFNW
jgi:hypothetical protein